MYSLTRFIAHYHHPALRGFSALTLNYLFMVLGAEMVGAFGVLFIWELGSSFAQSVLLILLFFGLQRIVVALSLFPIGHLYGRYGYRWIMGGAQLLLALKLWLLSRVALDWNITLALAAFLFGGFYIGAYYLGFHALFLDDNDDHKIGEQMGSIIMIGRLASIISPILSGVLIERFGFSVMFLVAMMILLLSVFPLFLMQHHHNGKKAATLQDVIQVLREEPRFSSSMFWWNIEDSVSTFFWPVFLFMILGSYSVFGAVGSLVMIASSVVVYVAGRIYDRRPLHRLFPVLTVASSLLWIIRFLSRTPVVATTADILFRMESPLWWMKLKRHELLVGEKTPRMAFAIAHEYLITLGSLGGLLLGAALLLVSNGNWYLLLLPALGGLAMSTKAMSSQ